MDSECDVLISRYKVKYMVDLLYDYPLLGKELSKGIESDFFLLKKDVQYGLILRHLRDELKLNLDYKTNKQEVDIIIENFIRNYELSYDKLDPANQRAILEGFEESIAKFKNDHPILSHFKQMLSNFNDDSDLKTKCAVAYENKKYEYILSNEMDSHLKSSAGDAIKNAAALCCWTYAFDPNRVNTLGELTDNVFHTSTRGWIPLVTEEIKKNLCKKIKIDNALIIKDTVFFNNVKEGSAESSKISLKDKIGYGTFKGIWGDVDLFAELERRLTRKRTGFFSMIYYRKAGSSYEFAYVASGTTFRYKNKEQLYDLGTDMVLANGAQAILGVSPQHTLAIQNAKILKKLCGNNKLYFYGHSLGGGMAIANALATDCEAIVFNNSGLNRLRNVTHGTYGKMEKIGNNGNSRIKRIYTRSDFLSTEKENKMLPSKILGSLLLSPQDIGEKIFFGTGGHGIEGICKSMGLEPMGHSIGEDGI